MAVEVEFLDCVEILLKQLFGRVLWKHQTIEASMSCRDALLFIVTALYAKLGIVSSITF